MAMLHHEVVNAALGLLGQTPVSSLTAQHATERNQRISVAVYWPTWRGFFSKYSPPELVKQWLLAPFERQAEPFPYPLRDASPWYLRVNGVRVPGLPVEYITPASMYDVNTRNETSIKRITLQGDAGENVAWRVEGINSETFYPSGYDSHGSLNPDDWTALPIHTAHHKANLLFVETEEPIVVTQVEIPTYVDISIPSMTFSHSFLEGLIYRVASVLALPLARNRDMERDYFARSEALGRAAVQDAEEAFNRLPVRKNPHAHVRG